MISQEILNYFLEHQDIFINLLDQFKDRKLNLFQNVQVCVDRCENQIESLLAINKQNYYFKAVDRFLTQIAARIDQNQHAFSVYGETRQIEILKKMVRHRARSQNEYFVMRLMSSQFKPGPGKIDSYHCLKCDEKKFNLLKKLQYLYHKEEVYENEEYYPYDVEMRNFKEILKKRINYAVLTDTVPPVAVSKAYVNAESSNAYQIGGIFTLPQFRNKGLSALCLSGLINDLQAQDKTFIYLFVKMKNAPAIHLYQKLGFETIAHTSILYF